MSVITAREAEQQYFLLVAEGKYEDALSIATQHFALFPPHAQRVVYFWRMEMACLLGKADLALDLLQEAITAGHWFANLDQNPTFHLLRNSTVFPNLVVQCAQYRAEEMSRSKPLLKILQPTQTRDAYPTLIALHGNSNNVATFAPHWQQAVEAGWLVVLPQSPQANGPDAYVWNDWDWVVPVLVDQCKQVCETYPVDPSRIVLAGFSMGAGLALRQAFERTIEVQGVLAVAPFLSDVEKMRPGMANPRNREMGIYLVASHEDEYCYEVAMKLSALLPEYGIKHQLDVYPDVGHTFPATFEQRISSALDFVCNR